MPNKIALALACALLAFLLGNDLASAANKKPRATVKNNPDIYSTHPDLPAEVEDPAREKRNYDWLGGYLSGNGDNYDDGSTTTSSPPNQPPHHNRNWRRHHSQQ